MKKRILIPFIITIVVMTLVNYPIDLMRDSSKDEFPLWYKGLNNINNSPNTPNIAPIDNDNGTLEATGNQDLDEWLNKPDRYMGQNVTNASILCNDTRSSYDLSQYKWFNDRDDLNYTTGGYNVTYLNATFFNIITTGYFFDVEIDGRLNNSAKLPYFGFTYYGDNYTMSFQPSYRFISILSSLNISLWLPGFLPDTVLICMIYNAVLNNSRVEPGTPLPFALNGTIRNLNMSGRWEWVRCTVPLGATLVLDPSNTYNNTYFVQPFYISLIDRSISWDFDNDPPKMPHDGSNDGFAYKCNGTNYFLQNCDFCLRQINITNTLPQPSQMNMSMNGTPIIDGPLLLCNISPNESIWTFSGSYFNTSILYGAAGYIFFNITTNCSLITYFMINFTTYLENQTYAITRGYIIAGDMIVNWNASIDEVMFPQYTYNKRILVRMPSSWNVSGVYYYNATYQNNTSESWINETDIINPLQKIVRFNVSANGSWTIDCNGTNWVGSIGVFNNTDFIEAYSYYLNDTIQINGTINTNSIVEANLTVFNPVNITIHADQSDIINNIVSFKPWQIIQNSTQNGTYYLQVVWFNGTEMGMNMTTIFCYNETTNLTVSQGPDPPKVIQGDPVTASIFYNDTYNNSGIPGANIISNWSYSSLNVIDFNNGSYNITFLTAFAPIDNYTVIINASKAGFDIATTIINFNVTTLIILEPTELKIVRSIPYTGDFLYVNDTGKFVIVNYTVKLNGSGIKGASIMTTPDWSSPYFQAEDLSYVNASQNGLYKIWLDTTGTHAFETHSVLFYATKSGYEPAANQSSPFQIKPIPTAIDVTGYENITKFEGETVNIAAYYKDSYHAGNPAIINAQVNWTINTTIPKNSSMQLNIVIYEGLIDLPGLAVPPGTYNVTIKAQAPDFQFMSRNITLNVLPKWNTTIWVWNSTSSEIRVGRDVTIIARIEFSNSSISVDGRELIYDVFFSDGFHFDDKRITNSSGIATLVINPIPEIDWIFVNVSYIGTPQIQANLTSFLIPILGKYEINLDIQDELTSSYIISGEEFSINVTLEYNNSGTWAVFINENVEFLIDYENYQDEELIITTDEQGKILLNFTPPENGESVIIYAAYYGNSSFEDAFNNSKLFNITKYATNLIIYDELLDSSIISGEIFSINLTVMHNKSGSWAGFGEENIKIKLDYLNYQDEELIITTDENGNVTLEFTPPPEALNVTILAEYLGNNSFEYTNDTSISFIITKYNVTLEILQFNALEMLVGNPLVLSCKLINKETLAPITNATVTFFVYLGDPTMRLFQQSAITDENGIATTALIIFQPFEVLPYINIGVEYAGDNSISTSMTTSSLPIIPMTTTKYVTNYLNQNWWWMAILAGAVIGASLAYRYGVKMPARRREIALQKRVAQKVQDAQNLKHAMIVHKESGTSIYGQGFGVELDSDLISGFLTAISAFQTEIGVKKEKKAAETGGFELNYEAFKILLTDGELSRFAFILQDRPSESFRQTANEVANQFEKEYGQYLKEWTGALKPFRTANRLIETNFEPGIQSSFHLKSLSKKESKRFSDLSSALIRIAKSEQKKKGHFYIEDILKIAIPARKEADYAIYYEIYNLYKSGIFIPVPQGGEKLDKIEDLKAQVAEISKEPMKGQEEIPADKMDLLKGITIPNLKDEEYEKLKQEITSMDQANQTMFKKEILFTPDEKRTKIVRNMLKQREKSRNELKQNLADLEKLLEKESPPFAEIFQKMETVKSDYEELGNEEKAAALAIDIQKILEKFDNVKEIKELRIKLSDTVKKAETQKSLKEFMKAALFYRRAARIYVEMGNIQEAEKLVEIANSCEQQSKQ